METAKIFNNGGSQAVRLPKEYRFEDKEVLVNKIGNIVLLIPKDERAVTGIINSLDMFTEDFMENRQDLSLEEREKI